MVYLIKNYNTLRRKTLSKEGRRIIASLLTAAAITAGAVGCNKNKPVETPAPDKDENAQTDVLTTNEPTTFTTTYQSHIPTSLEDLQFTLDTSANFANTLDCDSVYNLTRSIMYELRDLHLHSGKIVSDVVSEYTLAAIFMCESSYKINPDRGDKFGDSYAGIGQVNVGAITDSLKRIYTVYHTQSEERQKELEDNYYVKIFNKYVGDINNYYSDEQLEELAKNIFNAIEENEDNNSSRLGGAMSAITLTAIAGNNWTRLRNNPYLIEMTYYCGIGNMLKYINAGIIEITLEKIIFNLDKLHTSGLEKECIEKFEEGFPYMLRVHTVKNTIMQEGFVEYKDTTNKVLEIVKGNYNFAIDKIPGIEVHGELELEMSLN